MQADMQGQDSRWGVKQKDGDPVGSRSPLDDDGCKFELN